MSTVSTPGDPGQVATDPPISSIRLSAELGEEGNRVLDELDELFALPKPPDDGDDEPPTSRTPPPPLSRLAVRLDDCAFLVSLEDAADRDTTGRELVIFGNPPADLYERSTTIPIANMGQL